MASVSVACTITGPIALGSMCRSTTRRPLHARARCAATTWSLCRWASIEPRSSRAKIGTLHDRDRDDHRGLRRARRERRHRDRQQQARDRQQHVGDAHEHGVDPAAERAGERADHDADREPDERGQHADEQRLLGGEDHAGRRSRGPSWSLPSGKPVLRAGDRPGPQVLLQLRERLGGARAGRAAARARPPRRTTPMMTAPAIATGSRRSRRNASAVRLRPPREVVDAARVRRSSQRGRS